MKIKRIALSILLFSTLSLQSNDSVNSECKIDKRIVGACFKIHGRLSNWNGNPAQRIWIIGTKRIFGLREGTDLPVTLKSKLGGFNDTATADFEVCPFTPESPGKMQVGCVASVSNIKMDRRKP